MTGFEKELQAASVAVARLDAGWPWGAEAHHVIVLALGLAEYEIAVLQEQVAALTAPGGPT